MYLKNIASVFIFSQVLVWLCKFDVLCTKTFKFIKDGTNFLSVFCLDISATLHFYPNCLVMWNKLHIFSTLSLIILVRLYLIIWNSFSQMIQNMFGSTPFLISSAPISFYYWNLESPFWHILT